MSFSHLPIITAGEIATVTSPAALPTSEVEGAIRYSQSDDTLYTFNGASWTAVSGGGGGGITALTGDVSASGSGSVAATVNLVGGQSAANVAAGTVLANAATAANTASAIVRRDASGNFAAGTITAALTGTASGNPPNSRAINTTAPLSGGGDLSADRTLSMPAATNAVDGYLSAADHTSFAAKQAAGNYITALTGDVTASGPGSVAGTVASVGGASAASVATSVSDTQAATSSNTPSTIVKRDVSGNFSAGTITAALTGTASGNIVTLSGDVTTPGAGSGVSTLASVGTAGTYVKVTTDAKGRVTSGSASPLGISDGGTGQITASAAFDALAPTQTGNSGKFLSTNGSTTSWQSVASSSQTAAYSAPSSNVTLTNADNRLQVFAPTADISVTLPTTGVLQGDVWQITNSESAFSIQVKSSNTNNINLLNPGTLKIVAKVNTPTSSSDWYQLEDVTANSISFTGTGSWNSGTEADYFATFDRKGNKATIYYTLNILGSVSNTQLTLGLPSGLTLNLSVLSISSAPYATNFGLGSVYDGTNLLPYFLGMYIDGSNNFTPAYYTTGGTAGNPVTLQNFVTGTTPLGLQAGDKVTMCWTIPIAEWT